MSKQITVNTYVDYQSSPIEISLNTDLIYLQESTGDVDINTLIYYYGNPLYPTLFTVYPVAETVAEIVAASQNSLAQATIWQFNQSSKYSNAMQYAFPTAGFKITDSTGDDDINSAISYRNNTFYAEETQDNLVSAANAGGGGNVNLENVTSNIILVNIGDSLIVRADDGTYAKFVITKENGEFVLNLSEYTP